MHVFKKNFSELIFNVHRNRAVAGTTVRGICKATDYSNVTSVADFLVIYHVVTKKNIKNVQKISPSAVQFEIANISKSQYGGYICFYAPKPSDGEDRIASRTLHVGGKPVETMINAPYRGAY
jgi:hypothetical protein